MADTPFRIVEAIYPGLDAKIADALAQRQYVNGSMEYEFLRAAIEVFGDESLIGPETRRYYGPSSLERADLIRRPPDWAAAPPRSWAGLGR